MILSVGYAYIFQALVVTVLIGVITLVYVWFRRRPTDASIRNRARTDSWADISRRYWRQRSGSAHRVTPQVPEPALEPETLLDQAADEYLMQLLHEEERRRYSSSQSKDNHTVPCFQGPSVHSICYSTLVPPPSWQDASRNLIVNTNQWQQLSRQVELSSSSLVIADPNQKSHKSQIPIVMPLPDTQWQVHRPAARGVLTISCGKYKTEHTFSSAAAAAQFQLDALCWRVLGDPIRNLYTSLALLHRGANGTEVVLHHERAADTMEHGCAWDDVLRCLGTASPRLRMRLEGLWFLSKPESKRLVLGLVDIFRLFVPALPTNALPELEASRNRLETLLGIRKRVARAAVLAQAYVRARVVANRGWWKHTNPEGYWQPRLAFDDDGDNTEHDASAHHEYYEATVSRDVSCRVRGSQRQQRFCWWKLGLQEVPSVLSQYQAYSLVGLHTFEWKPEEFNCSEDPVERIPSLQTLLKEHPELHFFIMTFFLDARQSMVVHVYVRSLPLGVDPRFDTTVARFVEGDVTLRERKLETILQLGIGKEGLTFLARCLLWWLSILLRITLRSRNQVPQSATLKGRTSIPALNLSRYGETHHFGGKLQGNTKLPPNYIASSIYMGARRRNTLVSRLLLSYIEWGVFDRLITDMTFVLAGEREDELPERALCTVRLVREPAKAIPMSELFTPATADSDIETKSRLDSSRGTLGLLFKVFLKDPFVASSSLLAQSIQTVIQSPRRLLTPTPTSSNKRPFTKKASVDINTTDAYEKAVNELIRVLHDVRVPVKTAIRVEDPRTSDPWFGDDDLSQRNDGKDKSTDLVELDASILHLFNRDDIHRFFVASNCNLKKAAERIVATAHWRFRTFPTDTKSCRIELHSGQFFQQGFDLAGNPVFYFRNMCLGPWRKDEDAVIAAVLHRWDTALARFTKRNPKVQCTLVVLMGKPYKRKQPSSKRKKRDTKDKSENGSKGETTTDLETAASTAVSIVPKQNNTVISGLPGDTDAPSIEIDEETAVDADDGWEEAVSQSNVNNPRVHVDEPWYVHTNRRLVERLLQIVTTHYPERLYQGLVVVGHGNRHYVRSTVGGAIALGGLVGPRTRGKIRFMSRYSDLMGYISQSQLVTLVGGTNVEDHENHRCG